jgi:LemA protein
MPATTGGPGNPELLKPTGMLIAIFAVLVVLLLTAILIFNSLIRKKNDVENAFASIDVMLRKRYDLIPKIVETVKAYMTYERELLTEITRLRAEALTKAITPEERVIIENRLGQNLTSLLVAAENYPDLKAGSNFLRLQGTLNEVEEQLAASRRAFNAAVTLYNNSIGVFPSNIIASMMNYKRRTLFEIPGGMREEISARPPVNI